MRVFVIGGTGHIGAQLVPILVRQGHDVVIGARNKNNPFFDGASFIACDSTDVKCLEEIAKKEQFDVIVEFPGTVKNVWEVFKDSVSHIIACGSFWMYGKPKVVPTPEIAQERSFFEVYALRYQQIMDMILDSEGHKSEFTAIMPPNICGPGKIPLDTCGGRSIEVHRANMRGETVYLPEGPEAFITPCDSYDLAMLFALAINNREKAAGQIFNGGTKYALTSTQFVQTMADIYNVDIPVAYVPWEEYKTKYNPSEGGWWHFYAHMWPDISKAEQLLGYVPKYTPEDALRRAVEWMKEQSLL